MIKIINIIGRYLLFYIIIVVLFAIYSTLLDLLFYKIDYGSIDEYEISPFIYIIYFGIGYLFPTLPIAIVYNFIINNINVKPYFKISFGLIVGLLIGFAIQRSGISFYIGNLRPIKNIILFGLIGISIEILRLPSLKKQKERLKKN